MVKRKVGLRFMNKILVIKAGSTFPFLISKRGDFEHWILSGMQVEPHGALIVDVYSGSTLPGFDGISGVIISGSHAMVTEHPDWSERTVQWLREAVKRQISVLGICYGHQLLAYALGGEVGDNPNGSEFGTVEINLNVNARGDKLFSGFSSPIRVHVSHTQSVLRLPHNATLLASSEMDANQAFVVGNSVWGVQFHPEFDAEIVIEYINQHREVLLREKKNPDRIIEQCFNTPHGSEMLKRFVEILNEKKQQH
jgi:GMP synthase (glutamine-hydrolysing)